MGLRANVHLSTRPGPQFMTATKASEFSVSIAGPDEMRRALSAEMSLNWPSQAAPSGKVVVKLPWVDVDESTFTAACCPVFMSYKCPDCVPMQPQNDRAEMSPMNDMRVIIVVPFESLLN